MDYYDYDTFCRPTRDLKHSPLVEWPQHSFYQHNSLLSPDHDTPRKQEELGRFLSYPHHQQPRSYDALNLPQVLHSPYSAILQSVLHSPYSAVLTSEVDPNFVSVPQDTMEVPLSYALEGWDDDRPSASISSSPIPIPVPNLTKKSRGRRVPTLSSLEDLRSEDSDDTPSASISSSSPIPIPVPNLTKKSRGRRVPTMSSLEDLRSASSGAGKKRQGIGGKTARMYLCEVKGCGKCFARGEHLKRHVRSIHTYEKREVYFLCIEVHIFILRIYLAHRCPYPDCGKDFSRHDNLVQHLRVHKDYVPFGSPSSSSSAS